MRSNFTYSFVAALVAAAAISCGGTEATSGGGPGDSSDSGEALDAPSTDDGSVENTPDATGDATSLDATTDGTAHDATPTFDGSGDANGDAEASAGCVSPSISCDGDCANLQTDPNNCGICGTQCGTGTVCASGRCSATCGSLATCPLDGGATYCANTATDNANCGTCGHSCGAGTVCSGSACGITCGSLATCSPDGGAPYCANTTTDNANCGTCGHSCDPGTVCGGGTCGITCGSLTTCAPDGGTPYCANTTTDNANCGTCGHSCAAGTVCSGGACNPTCGGSLVTCGGACIDGQNDPNHCGATADCAGINAGVACTAGKSCVGGACVCDSKTTCNGACVDTTTDTNNCGGCGNLCQGVCVNGGCATSCANLLALDPSAPSGTYLVDPAGIGANNAAYTAYCDMTDSGGGWTLALKADGANAATSFTYSSSLWTNSVTLNPGSVDLSRTEAKFKSFSQIVASAVLLEVADTTANAVNPPTNMQVITLQSPATLLSLVNGPFTPTALGRSAWTTLTNNGTLQPFCNLEGFNAYFGAPYSRTRIGLIGNQEGDCSSPDSALGFGVEVGPGNPCFPSGDPSYAVGVAGGATSCGPAGANKTVFGYVFVR